MVMLFRTLGAVPLIHSAYQITGDPADPFERNVFKLIIEIGKIAVDLNI